MRVEYSSNNSGGGWWLEDEAWHSLEKEGWEVQWVKDDKDSLFASDDDRFLGALATRASYEIDSAGDFEDVIWMWADATGGNPMDLGCNCCGPPHSFTLYGDNDEYLDSRSPSASVGEW